MIVSVVNLQLTDGLQTFRLMCVHVE